MKHAASRELYDYWQRIRGREPAPRRSAVRPREIGGILASTLILEASQRAGYPVRLAGTGICGLYGREIGGSDFLDLWRREDRATVATLVATVADDGAVAVVTVDGRTVRGERVACEVLLLPLRHGGPRYDRLLGSLAQLHPLRWPEDDRIVRQTVSGLELIWPDRPAATPLAPALGARTTPSPQPLALAGGSGRRHGHLFVVEGGKA